jgi:hypothetical protein
MSTACPTEAYTQEDLLDVVERILPSEYYTPMSVNTGAGYEVFATDAAVMARVSKAAERLGCGLFMLTAQDPVYATGTVTFRRPNTDAGVVTIQTGSIVRASSVDRRFVTISTGFLGSLDLESTVLVRAVEAAYQYILEEPNLIDQAVKLILNPAYGDPSIYISSSTATTGGAWGSINALGADRGYPRVANEPIEEYRRRIRDLPDTVSVNAVQRAVDRFWNSLYPDYPATIIEGWETDAQGCLDSTVDQYGIALNDPRAEPPLHGRLLSRETVTNGFAVCLRRPSGITDDEFDAATAALWFAIEATKAAGITATLLLLPWEP